MTTMKDTTSERNAIQQICLWYARRRLYKCAGVVVTLGSICHAVQSLIHPSLTSEIWFAIMATAYGLTWLYLVNVNERYYKVLEQHGLLTGHSAAGGELK